jgi:hypothetical protein
MRGSGGAELGTSMAAAPGPPHLRLGWTYYGRKRDRGGEHKNLYGGFLLKWERLLAGAQRVRPRYTARR